MSTTQTTTQGSGQGNAQQQIAPNLYQLTGQHAGQDIHISYATSGFGGKPHFTYQDAINPPITFTGDQIRRVDSPDLGTVVSVTIRPSVDTGSTTLSVLVPRVTLLSSQEIDHIATEGIIVVHRIPLLPPVGQLDSYTSVRLRGTARHVLFAASRN